MTTRRLQQYGRPYQPKHSPSSHRFNLSLRCSVFLPFAAVSMCMIAGRERPFHLSLPVRGPFRRHVPGFHVPSDSVFPSRPRFSCRALPNHLHFDNCSDVFYFISSFNVLEPFQPSLLSLLLRSSLSYLHLTYHIWPCDMIMNTRSPVFIVTARRSPAFHNCYAIVIKPFRLS